MRRLGLVLALGLATCASGRDDRDRVPPVTDAATRKECGECHMAFQPALLPAQAWRRIMDGLGAHFGEVATLPPATAQAIRDYLMRNAGRGDPVVTRITEQPWWLHAHRPRRKPRQPAGVDCLSCHRDAERGIYDD